MTLCELCGGRGECKVVKETTEFIAPTRLVEPIALERKCITSFVNRKENL